MKELFIVVSVLVSISAIVVVASTYHWLTNRAIKDLNDQMIFMPLQPIIQERWYAHDYKSDITIMDVTDKSKQDWFMNYYHGMPSEEIIIRDNAQLDYVIQKQAHALTKQMIRDGCIKIINEPDIYSGHPLRRLIQLHFKIYKPE